MFLEVGADIVLRKLFGKFNACKYAFVLESASSASPRNDVGSHQDIFYADPNLLIIKKCVLKALSHFWAR